MKLAVNLSESSFHEQEIAGGATSIVYLCENKKGDRWVEKRQLPKFAGRKAYSELFRREFEFLSECSHSLIVQVKSLKSRQLGPGIEQLVLEEEYIEGISLEDYLEDSLNWSGTEKMEFSRRLSTQLLELLRYLHGEKGLIHSDLVPANLLVDRDGWIRLIDFGVARMADQRSFPNLEVLPRSDYSAPELFNGAPISFQSEIFSAGKILEKFDCQSQLAKDLQKFRALPNGKIAPEPLSVRKSAIQRADLKTRPTPILSIEKTSFLESWLGHFLFGGFVLFFFSSYCPLGSVQIRTLPLAIMRFSDGSSWTTPIEGRYLPAGNYIVQFVVPDQKSLVYEKQIEIRDGEHLKVFEDFRNVDNL